MDRPSEFWDGVAERYARQPVADEAAYEKKLGITRRILRPDMRVLELGCGTGSTALRHAPHVKHLLATDLSPKMIEIARAKADAAGITNVDFACASVESLEPSAPEFDVVLALSLLHLLEDRDAALARIYAWLVPGGRFVSSTPCLADGLSFMRFVVPVGRFFGLIPHVEVLGADELEASLTRAGFEVEERWQPSPRKGLFVVARKPG